MHNAEFCEQPPDNRSQDRELGITLSWLRYNIPSNRKVHESRTDPLCRQTPCAVMEFQERQELLGLVLKGVAFL